jgi:hypothetical protein
MTFLEMGSIDDPVAHYDIRLFNPKNTFLEYGAQRIASRSAWPKLTMGIDFDMPMFRDSGGLLLAHLARLESMPFRVQTLGRSVRQSK